jgi:putative heme transporter
MPDSGRLEPQGWTARRVRASWSSVLLAIVAIVAVLVARGVFIAASQPIGWVTAAAAVALVLAPVVDLQSRWMPRVAAILTTLVAAAALVASVGVALVLEVQDQLGQLRDELPAAAAELEAGQGPDGVFRQLGLESLVQDLVDQASERVSPTPTIDDAVGTVPAFLVSGVLVVFMLVWGRTMFEGVQRQISDPERREWVAGWIEHSAQLSQQYIVGAVLVGVLVAAAGTGLAYVVDLPTPLVLGVVLGAASVIPYFGILFGAVPVLLLTAASEPHLVVIAVAAALIGLQIAATLTTRLVVEARSLRVGPAVIVVATLIGSDVYGIGGALVALVAGIVAVAMIESAAVGPAPAGLARGRP